MDPCVVQLTSGSATELEWCCLEKLITHQATRLCERERGPMLRLLRQLRHYDELLVHVTVCSRPTVEQITTLLQKRVEELHHSDQLVGPPAATGPHRSKAANPTTRTVLFAGFLEKLVNSHTDAWLRAAASSLAPFQSSAKAQLQVCVRERECACEFVHTDFFVCVVVVSQAMCVATRQAIAMLWVWHWNRTFPLAPWSHDAQVGVFFFDQSILSQTLRANR